MKDIEVQELVLKVLYDENRKKRGRAYGIASIGRHIGIDDHVQMEDVAQQLRNKGLLSILSSGGPDDGRIVMLTTDGIEYVERGGSSGIIPSYEATPNIFVVNSTVGAVTTTVGGDATVAVTMPLGSKPEVGVLLDTLVDLAKKDSGIDDETKNDLLAEMAGLRAELSKKKPLAHRIEEMLGSFVSVASLVETVNTLREFLVKNGLL